MDLLQKSDKPQARVFREHLEQYRRDEAAAALSKGGSGRRVATSVNIRRASPVAFGQEGIGRRWGEDAKRLAIAA